MVGNIVRKEETCFFSSCEVSKAHVTVSENELSTVTCTKLQSRELSRSSSRRTDVCRVLGLDPSCRCPV